MKYHREEGLKLDKTRLLTIKSQHVTGEDDVMYVALTQSVLLDQHFNICTHDVQWRRTELIVVGVLTRLLRG